MADDEAAAPPVTRADRVIAVMTLALGAGLALIAVDVLTGGRLRKSRDGGCGCDDDTADGS